LDTQDISVAAGVVGVAVAALGLLLTWYRREEKEACKSRYRPVQRPPPDRRRARAFATVAVGIIALAAGGVVLTFKVGTAGQAPPSPGSFPSNKSSGASAALTTTQYSSRLGQICSEASVNAQRIVESQPKKTVLGPEITIEQYEVSAIGRLVPPNKLASTNAEIVAVWNRRISLLESIDIRLAQLSNSQLAAADKETDQLAVKLNKIFRTLDVPECVI
jgi:hypothetical protein